MSFVEYCMCDLNNFNNVLPLFFFVLQFFLLTKQGVNLRQHDVASHWLHAFLSHLLASLLRNFLYCYLFVTLCNEWSIATNEAKWPPHFQCVIFHQGVHHDFFPTLSIATGFMQKISCTFVMQCNEWSIVTSEA